MIKMDLTDSVVRLYIQKFIMPRALIFDKPGFVDFKISGKTQIFVRQLLFPESFFVNLEREVINKYGEKGAQILYSIGKRFGYSFAQVGRFENIKDHPGNSVKKWITIACKFVEGTYASEISNQANIEKETIDVIFRNFAICRKLGYDWFIAIGGGAGVMAWILQNPKIEGVLYDGKFEDNGDHFCRLRYAPPAMLEELKGKICGGKILTETGVDDLTPNFVDYLRFNAEVGIKYKKSFKDFLDARLFDYKRGVITYGDERFFLLTVDALYLLELGFGKENMQKVIFDNAFKVGKEIFSNKLNNISDILGLLSALGWGEPIDFSTKQKFKVIINHFPWTKWYAMVDHVLISGFLSGVFSNVYKKNIIFRLKGHDLTHNSLSLIFEGESA